MRPIVSCTLTVGALVLAGAWSAVGPARSDGSAGRGAASRTDVAGGTVERADGATDPAAALSTVPAAAVHALRAGARVRLPTRPQERPAAEPPEPREFFFTRGIYSSGRRGWGWGRGRGSWATDFPKADRQFLVVVNRLIGIDAYELENAVRLDDPGLWRFPFLYILEVGRIHLSPEEVAGLRAYLLAGGFLVVDDFWGEYEWRAFEEQMRIVLPEHPIVDVPFDHPIFDNVYEIDRLLQVPSINNAFRGRTSECGPCVPQVKGIFDERGRLMAVINWNTDLGDAWEHAENPNYPLEFSTFAYEMGINMIVYGMSH